MSPDSERLQLITRRHFLKSCQAGLGATALASLLGPEAAAAPPGPVNPFAPKKPHFAPKAKSVIFLFMYGGPSHVDTFDYKPTLFRLDGKTVKVKTKGRGGSRNEGRIVGPKWQFQQYGECGAWVSDLFPNLATCVDDISFVKSMTR